MGSIRALVVGWASFLHGEATAGDVLAMETVRRIVAETSMPCDTVWSPGFRPGALHLDDAPAERYTHLVFVCGPLHGEQVRDLHRRYAGCRRIAVGVSVVDPHDPAVTRFDAVLPRDGGDGAPVRDLSAGTATEAVPVVGVVTAPGQPEYGDRRPVRVTEELTAWLRGRDCARVPVDTRLDARDWRLCATAGQLEAIIARLDLVVTQRLHGLVLALKHGVPALAVDPVAGGAKVTAQARAWDWPAVVTVRTDDGAASLPKAELERWWSWCRTPAARGEARARMAGRPAASFAADDLVRALLPDSGMSGSVRGRTAV